MCVNRMQQQMVGTYCGANVFVLLSSSLNIHYKCFTVVNNYHLHEQHIIYIWIAICKVSVITHVFVYTAKLSKTALLIGVLIATVLNWMLL